MLTVTCLLILLSSSLVLCQEGTVCIFDTSRISIDRQPLYLDENLEYLYPNNQSSSVLQTGDTVILACSEALAINGDPIEGSVARVECGDSGFVLNNQEIRVENVQCLENRFDRVRQTDSERDLEIGFDIEDTFIPLITLIYDEEDSLPIYLNYTISKAVTHLTSVLVIPNYVPVDEEYYNFDIRAAYDIDNQRANINNLLGLPIDSEQYIRGFPFGQSIQEKGLSDGHSFYQGKQQFAPFRSIASVPVWSGLQNWFRSVQAIQSFVGYDDKDIQVFAGRLGVTTLTHEETGEEVELYLHIDGDVKSLPIPAILWKVLYEPVEKRAVVLITVNNVYRAHPVDIICQDVTFDLGWLSWSGNRIQDGYSYACAYGDVVGKIPELPEFEVVGLLTFN